MQHNLQLELLVAGIIDGSAHLCVVTNPGVCFGMDTIGCGAIGSGGLHANVRLALGKQSTTVNLSESIYNVYEAKSAAEAAPGVGKLTDIAVIANGATNFLDESALNVLASFQNGTGALAGWELLE